MPHRNMAQDVCVCVCEREMWGHLSCLLYTRYMTVWGCLPVVSTLFNIAFALYVSMSVYVVTRHTAAHPSPKSILWVSVWAQGCSDEDWDGGRRMCDGITEKDSSTAVIVKPTMAPVHSGMAGRLCP